MGCMGTCFGRAHGCKWSQYQEAQILVQNNSVQSNSRKSLLSIPRMIHDRERIYRCGVRSVALQGWLACLAASAR
jgi:hypothetical protein